MPDPSANLVPGSRVVVRRRLTPAERGPDGPHLTDVVGELLEVSDTTLTLATRRGNVEVARDAVVAAKVVPPRPVRRGAPHLAVGTTDLERVMVEGNPPLERDWLGGWLLRAGGGYTGRANSVLPLGDPGVTLDAAVDRVEEWYDARGLRRLASLFGPEGFEETGDPLGRLLLDRGYAPRVRVRVMTASTSGMPDARLPSGCRLRAEDDLSEAWFAAAGERVTTNPDAARAVLTGPSDQTFLSVVEDEEVVAVARVPRTDAWAGIFGIRVRPGHRRRGLGTALVLAGAAEARSRGIRSMYLQVEGSNAEAVALYERLGFSTHHEYVYLGA